MTKETLHSLLAGSCIVLAIDEAEDGALQVRTTFMYPNGDNICVFVCEDATGVPFLSDRGVTAQHIIDEACRCPSVLRTLATSTSIVHTVGSIMMFYGIRQDDGLSLTMSSFSAENPQAFALFAIACESIASLTMESML